MPDILIKIFFFFFFKSAKKRPAESEKQKIKLVWPNVEINECAEGTDRCFQNCHNSVGSYMCSMPCNVRFRLNANGYGCNGKRKRNIFEGQLFK